MDISLETGMVRIGGPVRLLDILKYSINTGMAEIGTLTGADILSKYIRDYGFGSETGIELPGEGAGILYNPEGYGVS